MRVVVLTGAGISAESGVATFRDSGGLWEGHDVMEVATPEGFERDPDLVLRFYDERRANVRAVEPNAAHVALARLEEHLGQNLTVVTQNVDDLHQRAGSRNVLHMHGELLRARCLACGERVGWSGDLSPYPPCPMCALPQLRPDIVWFGEMPYHMQEIEVLLRSADLFVAIGTSGEVYPAAGFAAAADAFGARTVEINLSPTRGETAFSEVHEGRATVVVPQWVDAFLSEYRPRRAWYA